MQSLNIFTVELMNITLCSVFVEAPRDVNKIWVLGDQFIRSTFGKFFQTSEDLKTGFMQSEFSIKSIDGNKAYCSNLLACLVNSVVRTLTTDVYMPKYIVVVLEDDLMRWVDYT